MAKKKATAAAPPPRSAFKDVFDPFAEIGRDPVPDVFAFPDAPLGQRHPVVSYLLRMRRVTIIDYRRAAERRLLDEDLPIDAWQRLDDNPDSLIGLLGERWRAPTDTEWKRAQRAGWSRERESTVIHNPLWVAVELIQLANRALALNVEDELILGLMMNADDRVHDYGRRLLGDEILRHSQADARARGGDTRGEQRAEESKQHWEEHRDTFRKLCDPERRDDATESLRLRLKLPDRPTPELVRDTMARHYGYVNSDTFGRKLGFRQLKKEFAR